MPAIAERPIEKYILTEGPKTITSKEQHAAYVSWLLGLQRQKNLKAKDLDTAKLLVLVIKDYESRQFPAVGAASPTEVLEELMSDPIDIYSAACYTRSRISKLGGIMKLTIPNQLFVRSTTCYVSSESGQPDHIVVYSNGTFFCDCRDFFVRHLPLFGTSAFSLCKHGEFARENQPKPKKFGVFAIDGKRMFRSEDVPGVFDTREAAQAEIDECIDRLCMHREVREL